MQNPRSIEGRSIEGVTENCPACQTVCVSGQTECFSCGIVFVQYARFQFEKDIREKIGGLSHLAQSHLEELDTVWKRVVVNYSDRDIHESFVRKCRTETALPFAIHCYSRMMDLDAGDDIAAVMRKRALAMLSVPAMVAPTPKAPIASPSLLFKWVNNAGIVLGVFVIGLGTMVPQLQNLVGLGVSFLFLFLVSKVYQKRYFS